MYFTFGVHSKASLLHERQMRFVILILQFPMFFVH